MINREVIYDRDVTGSYMKIAASPTAGMDEKLMLNKKLPGTLVMEKNFVDGQGQYWYLISGKQSLDTYCKVRKIDMAFVERLAISVCSQLETLEWNLIQTNCLMLDPELIFVANGSHEFVFTLYPGNNSRPEVEFQQLMEFLLTKLDHTDDATVQAAYSLYERTLEDGYSILDIRELILQGRQQAAQAQEPERTENVATRETHTRPSQHTAYSRPVEKAAPAARQPRYTAPPKTSQRPQKQSTLAAAVKVKGKAAARPTAKPKTKAAAAKPASEPLSEKLRKRFPGVVGYFFPEEQPREELVYPDEEIYVPQQEQIHETICISDYRAVPRGVLAYQGAEGLADIDLSQGSVRVGYGAEADVRIVRDTISQVHAQIDREADSYYIEDLNSTNGTFINDEPLAYKQRRQLKSNDIVRFADVQYRFG